jgi:hypothetical protein
MTATDTRRNVSTDTEALAAVLRHARAIDLPTPTYAAIAGWGYVQLQVDSVADLAEWAKWLGVHIDTYEYLHGTVHHTAKGSALELPIEVLFAESVA